MFQRKKRQSPSPMRAMLASPPRDDVDRGIRQLIGDGVACFRGVEDVTSRERGHQAIGGCGAKCWDNHHIRLDAEWNRLNGNPKSATRSHPLSHSCDVYLEHKALPYCCLANF